MVISNETKAAKKWSKISRNIKQDSRLSMSTLGLPSDGGAAAASLTKKERDSSARDRPSAGKTMYKNCFRSAKKFNFNQAVTQQPIGVIATPSSKRSHRNSADKKVRTHGASLSPGRGSSDDRRKVSRKGELNSSNSKQARAKL